MSKKKKTVIIVATVSLVAVASVLLGVFVPIKGEMNDTEYWSEYDVFDASSVATLDTGGEEFTVLQLTELHYHLPHKSKETDNIVKELVADAAPDLIVITGDSVVGPANATYTKRLAKLMDGLGVPWAIVYGNHDDEGKADKYWMGAVYENSEFCLYENGPCNVGGAGNYIVNITSNGQPFYSFMMMDSNRQTIYDGEKEFGSFTPAQVAWYDWAIDGLNAAGYFKSMMFFHIPFPEFEDAYLTWEESGFDPSMGSGSKNEDVCCSTYNPGMFAKILEKGSTTHVFVGHDHVNDYSVRYKGVTLTYGVKSSKQYYYREDMVGGTVIRIAPDATVTLEQKCLRV